MNSALLPAAKTANMTPPPTKAQLLRAAAVALHEKRTNTYRELVAAEEKAQQQLHDECLKLVRESIKTKTPSHVQSGWSGEVSVEFRLKKTDPELAVYFEKYAAAKSARENARPGSVDGVHAELRGSVGRDEMTARLLANPKLKAELLAGAEKLLSTPTKSDKASAINI